MNEIEEYLLMIFLESIDHLVLYEKFICGDDISVFELDLLNHAADGWIKFKQEELGRTIPEEFDLFISKVALGWLREGKSIGISIENRKYDNTPIKIKITVVEDD